MGIATDSGSGGVLIWDGNMSAIPKIPIQHKDKYPIPPSDLRYCEIKDIALPTDNPLKIR